MKKSKFIIPFLWLWAFSVTADAGIYTNLFFLTTNNTTVATTASVNIQSNQIGRVVYARFSNPAARVNVRVGDAKFVYHAFDLAGTNSSLGYYGPAVMPTVAGPAVIDLELLIGTPAGHFLCVVEVNDTVTQPTPSNAVVIPADAIGPVEIVLESSVDLVTWNPALPGTYGGTTTNRFFRVRSVRH